MPEQEEGMQPKDNILVFPALASPLLFHGVFNRHGGVSPAPWDSQNIAFGLGDTQQNILANRAGIKKALGCPRLVSTRQVHGSQVHIVQEKPEEDLIVAGFDGLISNIPEVGLMIQQADCQAVMLFDPEKMAVGIAHVGWRGSVAGIIGGIISAMGQAFATAPADLIAAISPSLGPCCAEFVNYRSELPAVMHGYQTRTNYFDFWAVSNDQLRAAGVQQGNIHTATICTRCNRNYFSYRREGNTGRFASVIGISTQVG